MSAWESNYKSHQGNIGLAQAIAYYTMKMIPVMIPLNDTQKYDLVVDDGKELKRVSVKTTGQKEKSNNYKVELKNSGGSSGKSKIRNFDNSTCDIVFIYTIEGDIYEIPSKSITAKSGIVLNPNLYGQYKVN